MQNLIKFPYLELLSLPIASSVSCAANIAAQHFRVIRFNSVRFPLRTKRQVVLVVDWHGFVCVTSQLQL